MFDSLQGSEAIKNIGFKHKSNIYMSWLDDIEQHRKRQVAQMAKAFGDDNAYFQKAKDVDTAGKNEKKDKILADKSDMYKMKVLGLRKFNEQDQKEYIGVEDVANSYITNHENGDIIISKTTDGYLVSKFPIDTDNEDIIEISNYLKNQQATLQNEYTGLFEGKNLVIILAESFSGIPSALSPLKMFSISRMLS